MFAELDDSGDGEVSQVIYCYRKSMCGGGWCYELTNITG